MRQGAGSVASFVAACTLLVGCGDDSGGAATTLPPITDAPTGATTGEASSPPTLEPVLTDPAPTTTAELGDEHVTSAETTMTAFFGALNNAKDTGDFSAFDALYTTACTGCLEMRAEMEKWLANGQTVKGGDWVLMQQTSSLRSGGSAATVFFLMYRTSQTVYAPDKSAILSSPISPIQLGSASLISPDSWTVDSVGFGDYTG